MRLVHQIWMQGWKYAPFELLDRMQTSEKHWGEHTQVMKWDEQGIIQLLESSFPSYVQWYMSIHNLIIRCDVARAFILHEFGGLYADCDYDPSLLHNAAWKSDSSVVWAGHDKLLGGNNAWMLALQPKMPFWLDIYIPYVQTNLREPSLKDIAGNIFLNTWSVLSTTGPFAIARLADRYPRHLRLIPYETVFKQWGIHMSKEPTWYTWRTLRLQRLCVCILLSFAFIGLVCIAKYPLLALLR